MPPGRTEFKASSKTSLCPVCGGAHKCSIGNDGLIVCGRRQGPQPGFVHLGPAKKDPQYHLYRRENDPIVHEREREHQAAHRSNGNGRTSNRDWSRLAADYQAALTPARRDELAADLGVRADALAVLQVGWCAAEGCWTFPERNGTGKIIGITRRWEDGRKKDMAAGRRGLYIPLNWRERGGTVFYPEGPSDTLALWSLGLSAIGRPNNTGGVADLALFLSDLSPNEKIIIVGDIDAKPTGKWPGRDGAVATAAELAGKLNRPVLWALPPDGKDVRAWLNGQAFDRGVADCWEEKGDELEQGLLALARPHDDSVSVSSLYRGNTDTESKTGHQPPVIVPFSRLQNCPPDKRWIWHGYLARSNMTLLAALYKCGKTTLLSYLLRALAQDGEFCGLAVKQSKVLCITEEHEYFWADRRDRLGIGDHCDSIIRPFRTKPSVKEREAFLCDLKAIQVAKKYDLVILDTLCNLWPVRDENNASEVRAALMPVSEVIGDGALLLTHQFRKSGGEEGTASRGSGELMATMDILLELRRFRASERNDRRRVLSYLGRHPDIPAELVIQLSEDGTDYVAEGDRQTVAAHDLREQIETLLPSISPGISADAILDKWDGPKPRREKLYEELRRGAESRPPLWDRGGEGKRGKPFTFWRGGTADEGGIS